MEFTKSALLLSTLLLTACGSSEPTTAEGPEVEIPSGVDTGNDNTSNSENNNSDNGSTYTEISPIDNWLEANLLGYNCRGNGQGAQYGEPITLKVYKEICHNDYFVAYDIDNKIPALVMYTISTDDANNYVERDSSNLFLPDPLLDTTLQAGDDDYSFSGYNRGHMQAWADTSILSDALDSNFYTNIAPMTTEYNSGIWLDLENATRQYVRDNNVSLHVSMGSILGETTIGNNVNVPVAFYRIISDRSNQRLMAYLIYQDGDLTQPLDSYSVTIDTIEMLSGIDFNTNFALTPTTTQELESKVNWKLSSAL